MAAGRGTASGGRTDNAWDFHDFDTGHEIMVDMPEALCAILLAIGDRH